MNSPSRSLNPGLVLFVTSVAAFTNSFAGSSVNVALPPLGKEFLLDGVTLNWVATSFVLSTAAFLLLMGKLGDVFGRARLFNLGVVLFGVSSLLTVFSPSVELLIGTRVLAGLGTAMIFATATAILVEAYPPEQRGRVLGINIGTIYVGLSAGPFLGGLLTQGLGWRSLFLVHALMSLVVIVLSGAALRNEPSTKAKERIDWIGSFLYAAGLSILLVGLTDLTSIFGLVSFTAGLVVLLGFVFYESRLEFPVLDVRMFTSNRLFALSSLTSLISYSATFAVSFFLSLYLEVVQGLPPQTAGIILVAQPVVQAAFSPLAGRLSDKVEPRLLASAGMLLVSLGLAMLIFLDGHTSVAWVVSAQVLLGLGFGIFSSPNTNAIMGSVGNSHLGTASAVLATMRNVGQMASLAIALVLFSFILGKSPVSNATSAGFLLASRIGFTIFTVLCLLGLLASLARGKVTRSLPT